MKSTKIRFLAALLSTALLGGCVSIAKVEDLPRSAVDIKFDDIARRGVRQDGSWNAQTEYEYYFEIDGAANDEAVHAALVEAMKRTRYQILRTDKQQAAIIGERGLSMAEWSSVAGAYYRKSGARYQVYIKNAITQDITGSWSENRAKVIADTLCAELLRCKVRISFDDKPAA